MYLKSIEIQGFKSFANKIKLEFHNGFTAIVGPNGSGKSNVADAVRWVLGEQRVKQLRGGSMQDVIFAGTELRKPLSAAYVAITLDNSDHKLPVDYDEVTIARRLYRSGESEYIMNGVQVRLKDVQELFYDTGIGKEGYSIIGQGQIEKILSDKPEDRRELFDEAAGIVKFKARKNASIKKLENEKANKVRVNDILSELEKQVGPLEEQSRKAQIYLKTREQLKNLDTNVFLIENGKTTAELKDVDNKLDVAKTDLQTAQKEFDASKEHYESINTELEELEQTIEETRNKITNANIVRNQLESSIKIFEEQIRSAQKAVGQFHSRQESINRDLSEKNAARDEILLGKQNFDDEVAEITKTRDDAAAELSALGDQIDDLTNEVDEKRNQVLDLLNKRAGIKARQAALKEKHEQFEVRKSELSAKLISASSDDAEHDKVLETLRADFERICGEVATLNDRQSQIDKEIAEKKQTLTQTDEALRTTEIEYHQEKSKLDALINMTERYEGFGGSVKRVMEEKSREKGIVGVVADLIKTEPKYEQAIETALGGSIQNVVTDNEDTAKRIINVLKRERAGRATFLPLTSIKNAQPFNMMGVLQEPGIIGLADTLVKVAPEYRDVARSLLGRIVVADSFDHAAAAERKYQQKIRMVTLDGELFTPGGAISGGAFKNNSNLLGRRREIDGLKKNIEELKKRMEELDETIQEAKSSRNKLRVEQETIRTQLQSKFLEQNTARLSISTEEQRKEESVRGYESLQNENASIEDTKAALEQEEAEILSHLKDSEAAEAQTNIRIDEINAQLDKLREEQDEKASVVSKLETEVQAKRQKQAYEEQDLARIDGEINRLKRELAEVEENIQSGDADMAEKQKEIEDTKATIDSSHSVEDDSKEQLDEMNHHREELQKQQKSYLDEREALTEQKANLEKEIFRLESRKQKMEESLEGQINYMWAEYEITLTQAEELRDETMTE